MQVRLEYLSLQFNCTLDLQVQFYLSRNLTSGLLAPNGENEHKSLIASSSFSRRLHFLNLCHVFSARRSLRGMNSKITFYSYIAICLLVKVVYEFQDWKIKKWYTGKRVLDSFLHQISDCV